MVELETSRPNTLLGREFRTWEQKDCTNQNACSIILRMLRETLNVVDFGGVEHTAAHTPFVRMAVGGVEGPKYRTRVTLDGKELPMVAKEYSFNRPGVAETEALIYFYAWERFRRSNLPVPEKMYLANITNQLSYLFMSDVGVGLRRLVGINGGMRQEEIDAACIPFNRQQRQQIRGKTSALENMANDLGERVCFYNWHVGVKKDGDIRVFFLDLGSDNYHMDPANKFIDNLWAGNRASLVYFLNWLRV